MDNDKVNLVFLASFVAATILGFGFSGFLKNLEVAVPYLLMVVLFIVLLKIDIIDILKHLKRPVLITYILLMNLIVIPLVFYFVSIPFGVNVVIAILILTTLPTGVSTPAFTDISEGDTSLAVLICVLSTVISIFTMPFLFYFLLKTKLAIDYYSIFLTLLKLVVIPLVLSQIVKKFYSKRIASFEKYSNISSSLIIAFIISIVIAVQADRILSEANRIGYYLVILFAAFFLYQLIGYFMVFWLSKKQKIAVSNSKAFMNIALGITLGLTFFNPTVALILVLGEIPWSTTLIIFNYYKKYLP